MNLVGYGRCKNANFHFCSESAESGFQGFIIQNHLPQSTEDFSEKVHAHESTEAYVEAKKQLELNFDNRAKIKSAFIDKALNWSVLKSGGASAL